MVEQQMAAISPASQSPCKVTDWLDYTLRKIFLSSFMPTNHEDELVLNSYSRLLAAEQKVKVPTLFENELSRFVCERLRTGTEDALAFLLACYKRAGT